MLYFGRPKAFAAALLRGNVMSCAKKKKPRPAEGRGGASWETHWRDGRARKRLPCELVKDKQDRCDNQHNNKRKRFRIHMCPQVW